MINSFKKRLGSFDPQAYWREILAVFMLLLAIFFFRSEQKEFHQIIPGIKAADKRWMLTGLLITFIYIVFQGGIYKKSFSAIGLRLPWASAVILFLKRNFIGLFLPAGGVSALAYSPSQIRKAGFNKNQVHQASGLFGFTGLLTVFLAGLPVIVYTVLTTNKFKDAWLGLAALLLIIVLLFSLVRSIRQKGRLYRYIDKKFPAFTPALDDLFAANVNTGQLLQAILFSMGVELCGMFHIYIAMIALGLPASFGASAAVYIIAVLLMVISPFMRGLGAVEISMVYVLSKFGYSSTQALSITLLFRVFEFWLPLVAGLLAYAWKGRKIFLRIAPALLTFALGIVNIISVVTPPVHWRLHLLRQYIPLNTIHASNLLVLFVGLSLLVTSAFLFRGLRNAWVIALLLSAVSLAGNLLKALDYEEASIAAITAIVLIATASQYRIRSSNKWMRAGLKTAMISLGAVLLFGFVSFYFIDRRHFGIDFTWQQSLLNTLKSFLLIGDPTVQPITRFGHEFILLTKALGFICWGFLLFTLIKIPLNKQPDNTKFKEQAAFLLSQFGNSPTDYFKMYRDKLYFFSDLHEAFIAYRISNGFAIVLEEPVCAEENKISVLGEFDLHCRKMGLKPAFYRVDENSLPWFNQLRKNKMMIGQEAILEISNFTLEGKEQKSLRNGLNSLQKKGFTINIHTAPHGEDFMLQLKMVSDEWLTGFQKEERIFSQGMFDLKEISGQDIITIKDAGGAIKSFLNIIPDYAEDECTYDLIRKTSDAPGAAMDALIIKLIEYARERQLLYINLGMVPMTGIEVPDSTAEQLIKLASTKIRRFQHYRGLREFKEKYATIWENKYLIYDNDFDLLQLPVALNNVMKP